MRPPAYEPQQPARVPERVADTRRPLQDHSWGWWLPEQGGDGGTGQGYTLDMW